MDGLIKIVAFIIGLSVLVFVHELGHFLVARWCRVQVLRFSIGMGKALYIKRFAGSSTEWVLASIPLGGYVKMLDSREQTELPKGVTVDPQGDFTSKSVWQRIAIVAAGPIFNFIFAILLLFVLFLSGVHQELSSRLKIADSASPAYVAGFRHGDRIIQVNDEKVHTWSGLYQAFDQALSQASRTENKEIRFLVVRGEPRPDQKLALLEIKLPLASIPNQNNTAENPTLATMQAIGWQVYSAPPLVRKVVKGGAADKAGMLENDKILSIEGTPIVDGEQFAARIKNSANVELQVKVWRAQTELDLHLVPELSKDAQGKEWGVIKVETTSEPEKIKQSYGLWGAVSESFTQTGSLIANSYQAIWKMVTGQLSLKNVSGPITIADYAGKTAQKGWEYYVYFLALISISLGVMNLLPIPMLDGGHLMYYAWEILRGRSLSHQSLAYFQKIGLLILISLMCLAFFNDLTR